MNSKLKTLNVKINNLETNKEIGFSKIGKISTNDIKLETNKISIYRKSFKELPKLY